MKKLVMICLFEISFMLPFQISFSQDPFNFGQVCNSDPEAAPTESVPFYICSLQTPFWSRDNRLHFAPYGQEIFNAHMNIIVIQREGDDPGNWTDNEMFQHIISSAIDSLNEHYNNLCTLPVGEYPDCFDTTLGEPVYIPSINIQFSYDTYFIADDNYWGTASPSSTLTNYINSGNQWKRGINIYYTMDSTTYRLMVEEDTMDANGNFHNWVWLLPSQTNMELNQYMVLPNKYAEFIFNLNNYVPDTSQLISNTILGYSRIWRHELGHIFGLNHWSISHHYYTNECEYSIMHQGSLIACWLPPSEIGEMHRLLHTSNTRRYISPDTYFPNLSYVIEDTVTWNFNIRAYSDIIIEEGGKLEITCKLYMPEDARIIVKRGAQLIINGGLITSYDTVLWQGIEVWGTTTASQSTSGAQGKITIENGGTIENAITAVFLSKSNGSGGYIGGYEGGIIQIHDAHFINNRTGVRFFPYRNLVSGVEMDNLSYFHKSEFLTDAELADESIPENFLYLDGVKGINVNGCSFTNSRPEEEASVSERGIGIYSYDADFTVSWYPGEDPDSSKFTNLNYGIHATDATTARTFKVNHSGFFNNLTGIYCKGINNSDIIFNNFEIYYISIFHGPNDIFGGLYLDNCTGYTVEENNFYNEDAYPYPDEILSIGITVNNSEDNLNMIYRNTFDRLHMGILAQNRNRGTSNSTGLKLKCNICTDNRGDFAVTADTASANKGISIHQGAYIPGDKTAPAGNLFSHANNNNPYSDFNNTLSRQWIYYFHHDSLSPQDAWIPFYHQNITHYGYIRYTTYDDVCPTHYSLGDGHKKSAPIVLNEQELRTRLTLMENLRDSSSNALSLWIDAGNTQQLNYEVESSTEPEALDIYDELMQDSPYLSDTVLSSSIAKENVLVNAMIRDIMVANPHGVKKEALVEALEQRVPPVPDYMMEEIMEGLDSIALKEQRESEIAWYEQERALAFNKLMKIYLAEDISTSAEDSIISLITNHGNLNNNYYLATRYLEQGNTSNAFTVLTNLPNQFVLDSEQENEHQDYLTLFTMISNITQQGKPLDSLDNTSRQVLYQMAEHDSRPAIMAQNILQHIDSASYPEVYILPTSGPVLRRYDAENPNFNTGLDHENVFKVYPNPCNDYFIMEYYFEIIPGQASYSISDPLGRIIEEGLIEGQQNQLIRRTSSYSSGLYTIKLNINGKLEKALKLNVIR